MQNLPNENSGSLLSIEVLSPVDSNDFPYFSCHSMFDTVVHELLIGSKILIQY
jgi:hypothetical protein